MNQVTVSNKLRLSIVLYLNYLVHGIGLLILTQNMLHLSKSWDQPLATVSYVISGIGIGRIIAYYLLGSLSDRYGRKPILAFGMITYAIFLTAMPFVNDFKMAYGLTILAGIANSALDSATYPTFLELNHGKGAATVLIKSMMSLGEFILPLMVGFLELSKLWYGWSFIVGAMILAINFMMLLPLKFPKQIVKMTVQYNQKSSKLKAAQIALMTLLSVYGFTAMALMIHFTQWISLFAVNVLHMSHLAAHFVLSLYSVGSIIGVLVMFMVMQKEWVPDRYLIIILNALAFLSLGIICFVPQHQVVNIAAFVFGATAASGVMQIGLNIFLRLFPNMKGRITAIFFSFGSVASFTVPIVTGMLSQMSIAITLRSNLVVAAINLLLCVGVSLLLKKKV